MACHILKRTQQKLWVLLFLGSTVADNDELVFSSIPSKRIDNWVAFPCPCKQCRWIEGLPYQCILPCTERIMPCWYQADPITGHIDTTPDGTGMRSSMDMVNLVEDLHGDSFLILKRGMKKMKSLYVFILSSFLYKPTFFLIFFLLYLIHLI